MEDLLDTKRILVYNKYYLVADQWEDFWLDYHDTFDDDSISTAGWKSVDPANDNVDCNDALAVGWNVVAFVENNIDCNLPFMSCEVAYDIGCVIGSVIYSYVGWDNVGYRLSTCEIFTDIAIWYPDLGCWTHGDHVFFLELKLKTY